MNELLKKLVVGGDEPIYTRKDVEQTLYEMCDNTHSGCDSDCLVYELNGNKVPECSKEVHWGGCETFKDGPAMFKFIRSKVRVS